MTDVAESVPVPALRTASKNLVLIGLGAFSCRASMLLLLAICANKLGVRGLGQLEQALAVSLLLVPLLSLQASEAFLASHARKAVSGILAGASITAIACAVAFSVGIAAWIWSRSAVVLALSAHVATTMAWQFVRNFLRASDRFDLVARSELWLAATGLAVGAVLLFQSNLGIAGILIAIALGNCSAMARAIGDDDTRFPPPSFGVETLLATRHLLAVASRLVPNVLLWWAIEMSDRLILAFYAGSDTVGMYSAGARIAGIVMAVSLLLYQVWQPHAIRSLQRQGSQAYLKSSFQLFVTAIFVVSSLLLTCSELLLGLLFGAGFEEAIPYIAILVPAFLFASLAYFFGIGFYSERSNGSLPGTIIGFVASLALNFTFIPIYGAIAAAISSAVAYLLICVARYADFRSVCGVAMPWRAATIPSMIIVSQSLLLCSRFSEHWMQVALSVILLGWSTPHLLQVAKSLSWMRGGLR